MEPDAISPTAGQGRNPGPTDHDCGKRVATSYARLEKREISLEAITEPRPISPNNGYGLAVSGSFAGAGTSYTGVLARGSAAGCTGGSLLATMISTGFSSPFSSTITTGAVFSSASVSTTTAGTGALATLAIS